jgi:hypothetical protein
MAEEGIMICLDMVNEVELCVGGQRGCRLAKTCKRAVATTQTARNFHNPAEKLCDHYLAVTIGGCDE